MTSLWRNCFKDVLVMPAWEECQSLSHQYLWSWSLPSCLLPLVALHCLFTFSDALLRYSNQIMSSKWTEICQTVYAAPSRPHAQQLCSKYLFTFPKNSYHFPGSVLHAGQLQKMNIIIKSNPHLSKVHSLTLEIFPQYDVGHTNLEAS